MTSKQSRQTRQIEMVETHNIALSIHRIQNAPGYDSDRWKRCFYHAIGMTSGSFEEKKKLREALNLP